MATHFSKGRQVEYSLPNEHVTVLILAETRIACLLSLPNENVTVLILAETRIACLLRALDPNIARRRLARNLGICCSDTAL